MTALNTDTLIAAGGNLWEKGHLKRIYLNDSALVTLFDIDPSALKKLKADKKSTYYCLNTESFYSANGIIIRNAIRATFPRETVNAI